MNCCFDKNKADDFVINGPEFTSSEEYKNKFLKGRYRLEMRGLGTLVYGVEWEYISTGGFKILIPSFSVTPDVIIMGQFY